MRGRALATLLGTSVLGACVFSSAMSVRSHELLHPVPQGLVNSLNLEEQLDRGFIPEVLAFLVRSGGKGMEETRYAHVLGRALLESGDFRGARAPLERAHAKEGRLSARSEDSWLLAQAAYWDGTFLDSARWCGVSQSEGRTVLAGWTRFLLSAEGRTLYDGVPAGARLRTTFAYGRPNLVRVPVKVNGNAAETMVLDTGATISLVTESAARRFGIETVPEGNAFAYGLHDVEIPIRFGWVRELEIGGLTVRNVPFGILADDALAFQTTVSGPLPLSGILGVHLLKEFDWRIDYVGRKATAVRLDPAAKRGSAGQNIFFRRLKPMVRASFNREPWFLFLLDTGSEPTMVSRAGIKRRGVASEESSYRTPLEGIGKSRVLWGKMSNATVGIDRFMVRFDDVVVKEDSLRVGDGVVGSSFLGHFDVEILFGAMRVKLERPIARDADTLRVDTASANPG